MMRLFLLLFVFLWIPVSSASGRSAGTEKLFSVCPASRLDRPPPRDAPSCRLEPLTEIDPRGRAIWIRGYVDAPQTLVGGAAPAGLFVSARAATRAYVNGGFVGANGAPALDRAHEIAGRLDTVFFVPDRLLKVGRNEVLILASGHAPAIVLSQGFHGIALDHYGDPRSQSLPDYIPTLLAFGALIVGAIYFGVAGLLRRQNGAALALATASLLAAFQLAVEVSRGLWTYPYPVHGMRLALIVTTSLGVGLALAIHTAERLQIAQRRRLLIGGAIAGLACALFLPTFDTKTDGIAIVTYGGCAALAALAARQGRAAAIPYAVVFIAMILLVLFDPTEFFDLRAFLAFAGLLLFLFGLEARALLHAERQHEEQAGRRRQLEAALDRLTSAPAATLLVASAGRTEIIPASQVAVLAGAGDYVALHLINGREVLHASSLATLERELPPAFLRVHRSHIVNLEQIVDLTRLAGGVGQLRMRNDMIVPISRRIMPKVRRAIIRAPC